jgi:hypothetical protein
MSKIKMRCTTCGKWFQSANAKEVTCPDCVQKARKEKLAAKTAPPSSSIKTPGQVAQGTMGSSRPAPPPPPKPKQASSGTSHWIDSVEDVKVSEPEQPQRPKLPSSPAPRDTRDGQGSERFGNRGPADYREGGSRGPGGYRDERSTTTYREGGNRGPAGYRPAGPGISGGIGQRPRQPMEGGFGRVPRPGGEPRPDRFHPDGKKGGKPIKAKVSKPPTPPKPKREKIPPPAPFTPAPEQIAQVEARYMELAVPAEFDGIRTQIAQELSIPKKAVKKIVKDLRDRQSIPSWWELQTYKGDSEELAKIKAVYEPHLPLPPVGVHKTIADELSLKPGEVYQAIKAIRLEMNLPQYNDPALHGLELTSGKKKQSATSEEETKESQEEQSEAAASAVETPGETIEVETKAADTSAEPVEVAATTSVDSINAQE